MPRVVTLLVVIPNGDLLYIDQRYIYNYVVAENNAVLN